LIDCLIRLILTLHVSTARTEVSFSAMKIIKIRLWNKMEDEFLAGNMIIYIEKEIAKIFSSDSIIDEFKDLKQQKDNLLNMCDFFFNYRYSNLYIIFMVLMIIIKYINFECIIHVYIDTHCVSHPLSEMVRNNSNKFTNVYHKK